MEKRRALGLAAMAATASAYPFLEARLPRLRHHVLEVDFGVPRLRILHLSDTHLHAGSAHLSDWVSGLATRVGDRPDFVIGTGDFIEDDSGIPLFLDAVEGLEARYGCFYVLGSHDYYQAEAANYLKYFIPGRERMSNRRAATGDLEAGLKELGWRPLTNATEVVDFAGHSLRFAGMDDPYLDRHDVSVLRRSPSDDVAIAVVHAPDVVAEAVLAGFDLVLAGHTHGGQVRIPGIGAVVTNSKLPAALAAGPRRVGGAWLHVTPGIGTGKFTPIRFNCRPEATLLELVSWHH